MKYLLLILLMLNACKEPSGIEENVLETVLENEILPLSEENEWVYLVHEFNDEGQTIKEEYTQTISIIDSRVFNDKVWFKVNDSKFHLDQYYRNDGHGLWTRLPDFFGDHEFRIISYPMQLNNKDTLRFLDDPFNNDVKIVQYMVSDNQEVELLDSKIECYVYESHFIDSENHKIVGPYKNYYYSLGIGLVKEEQFESDEEGNYFLCKTRQLKEFRIKR